MGDCFFFNNANARSMFASNDIPNCKAFFMLACYKYQTINKNMHTYIVTVGREKQIKFINFMLTNKFNKC